MKLFCIDPGSKLSAWLLFEPLRANPINGFGKEPNDEICRRIMDMSNIYDRVVAEGVVAYINPYSKHGGLGTDILDTAMALGRFWQCAILERKEFLKMSRRAIATHVTGLQKPNDSLVRAALIKRFGEKGTMQKPGPTFGIADDVWSALAIGCAYWDKQVQSSEHDKLASTFGGDQ